MATVKETRVVREARGYRVQVRVWAWSMAFLAPFPTEAEAERFCRMEWPEAKHIGTVRG